MARIVTRPTGPDRTAIPTAQPSLTAAAPMEAPAGRGGTSSGDDGWQADAWGFYNTVPELRYVCQWLSNALSRCNLIPSEVNAETGQPTGDCTDLDVTRVVGDIAGGPAGQAQLLSRLATFLTVPGDCWVAIILRAPVDVDGVPTGPPREEWHVLSKDEVTKKAGGSVEIQLPDGTKHALDDDTDTITRVHRPHPRNAALSDSPVRACIPVLREIVRLGQWVEATAKSRLSGAGILAVASELSARKDTRPPQAEAVFGTTPTGDAPTLPPPTPDGYAPPESVERPVSSAADLMDLLIQVASATIQDPNAASATVPIVVKGKGEYIDKIKHLTFGQEFTEVVLKLRESATRRLALTLDVPAEVLLGTGDMNHWSAWQVEESAIKLHVEPLLTVICDALTEYILRPLLELNGHPDPAGFVIWYSTANLALRPNRSADAKDAYNAGVLSVDRYLREVGFDPEEDAPQLPTSDDERFRFAYRMAMSGGAGSDAWARALAEMAGIPLPASVEVVDTESGTDPADAEEKDRPGGDEVDPIPEQPDGDQAEEPDAAQVASVSTALYAAVSRRLELAGKRARTRTNLDRLSGVTMAATHVHLDKVSSVRARQLVADTGEHDAALAKLSGVSPTEFEHTVTRTAAELVETRSTILPAALTPIARRLTPIHRPLRSVQ